MTVVKWLTGDRAAGKNCWFKGVWRMDKRMDKGRLVKGAEPQPVSFWMGGWASHRTHKEPAPQVFSLQFCSITTFSLMWPASAAATPLLKTLTCEDDCSHAQTCSDATMQTKENTFQPSSPCTIHWCQNIFGQWRIYGVYLRKQLHMVARSFSLTVLRLKKSNTWREMPKSFE